MYPIGVQLPTLSTNMHASNTHPHSSLIINLEWKTPKGFSLCVSQGELYRSKKKEVYTENTEVHAKNNPKSQVVHILDTYYSQPTDSCFYEWLCYYIN